MSAISIFIQNIVHSPTRIHVTQFLSTYQGDIIMYGCPRAGPSIYYSVGLGAIVVAQDKFKLMSLCFGIWILLWCCRRNLPRLAGTGNEDCNVVSQQTTYLGRQTRRSSIHESLSVAQINVIGHPVKNLDGFVLRENIYGRFYCVGRM